MNYVVIKNIFDSEKLPNWQNKDDYEKLRDLPNREMAWQFLRRNQGYISAYGDWVEMIMGNDECSKTKEEEICERYGLSMRYGIANPHLTLPPPFFCIEDKPVISAVIKYHFDAEKEPASFSRLPDIPEDPCMDVRIYAERSLKEQFEALKPNYKRLRKMAGLKDGPKSRRQNEDKYIRYLQIIDATTSEVSVSEIVSVLEFEEDSVVGLDKIRHQKKAAMELVDGGYIKIAGAG